MVPDVPSYEVDFYASEVVADPHRHYKAIRDLGPAVWLPKNELYALGRYADAKAALKASTTLISGKGVSNNRFMNNERQVATLVSDGELHRLYRSLVMKPIIASEARALREEIRTTAETLIDDLLARGPCDGMTDLAQVIPVSIVSHLVGLPEEGRENMLKWAAATFDTLGSLNELARKAVPSVKESFAYTVGLKREDVRPGGWASRLFDAADEGILEPSAVPGLLQDYIAPSLDTAIFAIGHTLDLLGRHPEQWAEIRKEPKLITKTINEVLRMEAPIRAFTRYVNEDYEAGEVRLPKDSRVVIIYGSANRDERHYPDPDRFDIHRSNNDHLGFGYGVHHCLGVHLAKAEISSLLEVMAEKVERIEVGTPELMRNNVLRGFSHLPLTLH
ncbi:MAG: cytochrome P450 [Myxococcota bacterium]